MERNLRRKRDLLLSTYKFLFDPSLFRYRVKHIGVDKKGRVGRKRRGR